MVNHKHGGLSGKARRTHKMSRAARLHTQEMIADYLEPADWGSEQRERPIHMGRRSEFLPSISSTVDDPMTVVATASPATSERPHAQLELPLAPGGGPSQAPIHATSLGDTGKAPGKPDPKASTEAAIRFAPVVTSPGTKARLTKGTGAVDPNMFSLRKSNRRGRHGRLGGFLYGCLMGSAAAAIG